MSRGIPPWCFVCRPPYVAEPLIDGYPPAACTKCTGRARLVLGDALVADVVRPAEPLPTEGNLPSFLLNPVVIDGRRGWVDFAEGRYLIFEEVTPSTDFFDYLVQHVGPWPGLLRSLSGDEQLDALAHEAADAMRVNAPPHSDSRVNDLRRLYLCWYLSRRADAVIAARGPIRSSEDTSAAVDALTELSSAGATLGPRAMVDRLRVLAARRPWRPDSIFRPMLAMPAPVFSAEEQEALAADPDVRPYAGITRGQLLGLLSALSEYGMRTCLRSLDDETPLPFADAATPVSQDVLDALRAVVEWYRHTDRSWLDRNATVPAGPPVDNRSHGDEWIFDATEQQEISYLKYGHGFEHVTRNELVRLLEPLGRYTTRASRLRHLSPLAYGCYPLNRMVHAHNRLVSFRDHPFDYDEYSESVRDVIALTRVDTSE